MQTFVAIGGTGQMVLHFYYQLYLVGLVGPFRSVIIDTDEVMPSLRTFERFFENLQYGQQPEAALGAEVPRIDVIGFDELAGESAYQLFTNLDNGHDASLHPVNAFFSNDALIQDLRKGLFARPALSSSLSRDVLLAPSLIPTPEEETVILVGSIIGGTGGGLIAPVLDALRENAETRHRNAKLRAVLFGEYFSADEERIEDGQKRLQSNQTLALRALGDARTKLHSYYIVGGPGYKLVAREPNEEKAARNLPWPSREHPYEEGIRALNFLSEDTATNVVERFADRDVGSLAVERSSLSYDKIIQRLPRARAAADKLVREKVVERAAADPFHSAVWGKRLSSLITHFWHIAADHGGAERTRDFPAEVQQALEQLWHGEDYGLRDVFPRPQHKRVKPGEFSEIHWPSTRQQNRHDPLFDGEGSAARRAAATLLFWTLRDGLT